MCVCVLYMHIKVNTSIYLPIFVSSYFVENA